MADSYVIRQGTERNTNPMFMEIMAKDLTELAKYASRCTPGSLGYLEDATVYRLGTQGTWVKVGDDFVSRFAAKADVATTYTKTEVDAAIAPVTSQLAENTDNAALWRTASSNPAACYPVPKSRLYPRVELVAPQSGAGDPSPSNVRPIVPGLAVGQKVKAKRTGKNLISTATLTTSKVYGITYVKNADGSVSISGTATADTDKTIGSSIALIPGQYTFGITTTIPATGIYVSMHNQSETMLSSSRSKVSFTLSTGKTYGNNLYIYITAGVTCNLTIYPQLELGSTATSYEPYSGADYDLLTAAQNQYGVTGAPDVVDCETNLLTTSTALFSLPTTGWSDTNFAADGYFSIALSPAAAAAPTVLCSHFLPATTAAADSNKIVVSGATVKVYPADAVATDLAGWHTWLGGNAVKVVYQLATATTAAITPPAIAALDRISRTAARANVLVATANDSTAAVSALKVTYQKSPIRVEDELLAAIAALA